MAGQAVESWPGLATVITTQRSSFNLDRVSLPLLMGLMVLMASGTTIGRLPDVTAGLFAGGYFDD